jgi:hypothetical protein
MALLMAWGVLTTAFVFLLIYRSLISMKEEDQLFLDPAEYRLEEEQRQVLNQLWRLAPYMKGVGFASAGLFVVIVGVWVYQGITLYMRP